jgi:hypothetical protein
MKRRAVLTAIVVTAAGLGVASPPWRVDAAAPGAPARTAMDVNTAVVNYIAVWNERDAKRRRALVAQTWSEDGSYAGPSREGVGLDAIDSIIATAQEQPPAWRTSAASGTTAAGPSAGWRMSLASGIDAHHDYVRFSWTAGGTPDAPLYVKGTVFAVLAADGRFKSVIGFTDAGPARAPK